MTNRSIITVIAPEREPVVVTALSYLRDFLHQYYDNVMQADEPHDGSHPADHVMLRLDSTSLQMGGEGYSITSTVRGSDAGGVDYVITASTSRGLLYGTCRLIAEFGRQRPPWKLASRPALPIREWATHVIQGNFNLPLGGSFDRPMHELEDALNRIIDQAPYYGINRLQLDGRAGEGIDIDWFLPYRFLPGVHRQLAFGEPARRLRREMLRRVAERARHRGMELLAWNHELVFPGSLLTLYPELKGKEYPVCFSRPFWDDFLTEKIREFFTLIPEVGGITLTFAETRGYNILEHRGCQCDACRDTPMSAKLSRVVGLIDEVCRTYGKLFELRTYNQRPEHGQAMEEAVRGLPKSVTLMTKIAPVDFRGVHYPLDPMIGAFPGQSQIVEFTLAPECNGYAYVPAVLAEFYAEKMKEIIAKGVQGVVGRLDYHLQFSHAHFFTDGPPVLTTDTENGANVHVLSRLMWDPDTPVDTLLAEWAVGRYGEEGPNVLAALERTCSITQGIFFTLGIHGPSQLDQIADPDFMQNALADNFLIRYFPDDPEVRERTQAILHPTEAVFAQIMDEKERAVQDAEVALTEIEAIVARLEPALGDPLLRRFRLLYQTARVWRSVAKLFFRWLMWKDGNTEKAALDEAANELLEEALRFERLMGPVFPVYNAARGVSAYEFLLRIVEGAAGAPSARMSDARLLWDALVEACKSSARATPARAFVHLDDRTRRILIDDRRMLVTWSDGEQEHKIAYPLPLPIAHPLALEAPAVLEVTAEVTDGAIALALHSV